MRPHERGSAEAPLHGAGLCGDGARRADSAGPAQAGGLLAAVFLDGVYEEAAYYLGWAAAADLVVAADGGAGFLLAGGVRPDVVVGDFDSLAAARLAELEVAGVELVRHPVRKDSTDGELAVDEARRRGAAELVLAGALGALDHTLGHLAVLRRLEAAGVPTRIVAPELTCRVLLAPAEVGLDAPAGARVSLAPLGAGAVVTLRGLVYPLERGTLPADACLGLGNAVAGPGPATVAIHDGVVAVLVEHGGESFLGRCRTGRPAA
jgi:thiamine pyrophosphokinase